MVVSTPVLGLAVLIYLMVIFYLGWVGYKKNERHRRLHDCREEDSFIRTCPFLWGNFHKHVCNSGVRRGSRSPRMGLLWLTFMNVFVGIFIAFVIFGSKTRRMGLNLRAVTFPELMGRRFESRFIQGFSGILLGIFMPLYSGIVLIGAARFLETTLGINYDVAVLVFTVIIAAYVITGGLIAVMYTDALQGALMFVGMGVLMFLTYSKLGGITEAHRMLTDMAPLVPESLYREDTWGGLRCLRSVQLCGGPLSQLLSWELE